MKYWSEITNDVFSCFQWFSKDEAKKIIGYVPQLSVFSIIGSMIFSREDRERFTRLCSESVGRLAIQKGMIDEYRFFLFGVIETHDVNSKIFLHQKLWRRLTREFNLDNLILGPEIEYVVGERLCYASIAQFKVDNFYNVLQIINSNPQKYSIFASKKQDYMTEGFIKSLLEKVYINGDSSGEIDYFKLSLTLCIKGDLVFRWGNSSEECELDIITLGHNIKMFDGFSFSS
ncbi:hypothetical protein EEL32_06835 [Brevibacillus laterosporus]|nr:hypothetical protein [Brevibacillus laterosporus]TPG89168.1 hypothetical protein EEL32_06835 [Brevibacillus laterosporus]